VLLDPFFGAPFAAAPAWGLLALVVDAVVAAWCFLCGLVGVAASDEQATAKIARAKGNVRDTQFHCRTAATSGGEPVLIQTECRDLIISMEN
jgi:hypothetical protein